MTIPEILVAYAICWWLVLFMVLPRGAEPAAEPARGHARSAPAEPRLKRKFILTSLWAVPATALVYLVFVTNAHAADEIYHVGGGGCEPIEAHVADADVAARDGYGVGGKKVAPATTESANILGNLESVDMPIQVPSENYIDSSNYNADFSETFVQAGTLKAGMDGSLSLNGRTVNKSPVYPPGCNKK